MSDTGSEFGTFADNFLDEDSPYKYLRLVEIADFFNTTAAEFDATKKDELNTEINNINEGAEMLAIHYCAS